MTPTRGGAGRVVLWSLFVAAATLVATAPFAAALIAGRHALPGLAAPSPSPPPQAAMLDAAQEAVVTIRATTAQRDVEIVGSGWLADRAGRVVTADHVVRDAWTLEAITRSGGHVPALLVAEDRVHDIAELEVTLDAVALPVQTTRPARGDRVYVLGNPGGKAPNTTTPAVVSAPSVKVDVDGGLHEGAIELSAPGTDHGDSGGPVIDSFGRVVGVLVGGQPGAGLADVVPSGQFAAELAAWRSLPGHVVQPPAPRFVLESVDFASDCAYARGCPVRAKATNSGAPGTATALLTVLAGDRSTTLAQCQVVLTAGREASAEGSCTAQSRALQDYIAAGNARVILSGRLL